jgi:hypothetical protein
MPYHISVILRKKLYSDSEVLLNFQEPEPAHCTIYSQREGKSGDMGEYRCSSYISLSLKGATSLEGCCQIMEVEGKGWEMGWACNPHLQHAEPESVNLLRSHESIPGLPGRYDNPTLRTGPSGYIGWRNLFLGIDSWAQVQIHHH